MRLIDADALDKERIDYIVSGYANSPEDCAEFGMMIIKAPTICDIEQIRAEIQKVMNSERDLTSENAKAQYIALGWCLEIIDKHIKGNT